MTQQSSLSDSSLAQIALTTKTGVALILIQSFYLTIQQLQTHKLLLEIKYLKLYIYVCI